MQSRYRRRRTSAPSLLCIGMFSSLRRRSYADYLFVYLRKIGVIFKTYPGGDYSDRQAGGAQDGLCVSGRRFVKRAAPLPDLRNERIFPGGLRVKIRFAPDCKWRLVEEFGVDSFQTQEDGTLLFYADYTDKENLLSWLLSFREKAELLEPEEGDFLRGQYEDILPGYYMNKVHWNSIRPDGAVPDSLMKELLDQSYRLVLGSFSRKKQREILEAARAEAGGIGGCGTAFPG